MAPKGLPRAPSRCLPCGSPEHTHESEDTFDISEDAFECVERWEHTHERLTDDQATVFAALCEVVKPVDREFMLKAKTANDLLHRIQIVMAERDGLGALVRSGPTGTNVGDLQVLLLP